MKRKEKTRKGTVSSSFIPHDLTINDFANSHVSTNRLKKASSSLVEQVKSGNEFETRLYDDDDATSELNIPHLIFWMINRQNSFTHQTSTAKGTLCSFLSTLGVEKPERVIIDATYLTVGHRDPRYPTAVKATFAKRDIRDVVFNEVRSKKAQHGMHVSCEYEYCKRRQRAVLNKYVKEARRRGCCAELVDDKLIIDGSVYVCEPDEVVIALETGERFDVGQIPKKRDDPIKFITLLFLGLECSDFNYTCPKRVYDSVCKYLVSLGLAEPTNMVKSACQIGPCGEGNSCPTTIIKVKAVHSFVEEILLAARQSPATRGVRIVREVQNTVAHQTYVVLLQYFAKAKQLELRPILLTGQLQFDGKTYYCDSKGRNICEEDGQPAASLRQYVRKVGNKKNIDDRPPDDAHLHLLFTGVECICTEDDGPPSKKCARSSLCSFLSSILGIESPKKMIRSASHVEKLVENGKCPRKDIIKAKFLKFEDVHSVLKLIRRKRIPGISVCYDCPVDPNKAPFFKSEEMEFYTTQQPARLLIENTVYVCDKNRNVVNNVDGSACDLLQIAANVATCVGDDGSLQHKQENGRNRTRTPVVMSSLR